VSPRRFNRRTYMIAASGRSALTLKAAMSASSAPTTIRSTFPFAITPTVNCQDILGPSSSKLGYERAHRPLRASSVFFVPGCELVVRRPRFHASSAPKRVGRTQSNGHHMLNDPPHGALHVLASVNNGACCRDGNSVTPAQVLMRTTGGYKGLGEPWFVGPVLSRPNSSPL
jgi:hypothetical protein